MRQLSNKKKKYDIPIKHSISYKITILIVAVMVLAFVFAGLFSTMFMEKYYTANKRDSIKTVYSKVSKLLAKDETLSKESSKIKVNNWCEKYGTSIAYIDTNGDSIYIYGSDDRLTRRWKDSVFAPNAPINFKADVIEENSEYTLTYTTDVHTKNRYYELISTDSDNQRDLVIQLSVENFKESIAIANKFYALLAIFVILIITVVLIVITRKYTLPILALADLSKKMSELNFDAKYTGTDKGEIGVLGDSMNEMSDKLEKTILELKNANIELHKDIKKKEEVDNMRKEFISNISHELKTPIALIQGYAEGLKEGMAENPEDADYYCEVIMDEANKMNKMVLSLLSLNQIEAGGTKINIERFDLIQVLKANIDRIKMLAGKEDLEIELDAMDSLDVLADEYMIEEVISNYLSNAIHHVDEQKIIKVSVSTDGEKIRVSVFNSGKPIPEEDIDRIWEKFYKVDKARTREYGGTGIGLSIVKAIMEGHNNAYGVLNKNNGVEFFFELDAIK